MSYDLVKSIRELILKGIGDTPRLKYILDRLENGKYLFLTDQKYLEKLLISKDENEFVDSEPKIEFHSLQKLEANLKTLNNQLEKAIRIKKKDETMTSTRYIQPPESRQTTNSQTSEKDHLKGNKNENLTLVLSIVLGFISLQGVGHIYLGKVARGLGILVLSMLISSIGLSYFLGIVTKNYMPAPLAPYFILVLITGYLGLYVFQILDGHKLCVTYNRYQSQHGEAPPWW